MALDRRAAVLAKARARPVIRAATAPAALERSRIRGTVARTPTNTLAETSTTVSAAAPDLLRRLNMLAPLVGLPNFEHAHHSLILMLQYVAVIHPAAGKVVKVNDDAH